MFRNQLGCGIRHDGRMRVMLISKSLAAQRRLRRLECRPIEVNWISPVTRLYLTVSKDMVIRNCKSILQVHDKVFNAVKLWFGVLLLTAAHHFNANAVVVVDPTKRTEHVYMNGSVFRINSLVNGAVAVHNILSAGVPHPAIPTCDDALCICWASSFCGVHDDVFHFFSAIEDATTQRIFNERSGLDELSGRILIGVTLTKHLLCALGFRI